MIDEVIGLTAMPVTRLAQPLTRNSALTPGSRLLRVAGHFPTPPFNILRFPALNLGHDAR